MVCADSIFTDGEYECDCTRRMESLRRSTPVYGHFHSLQGRVDSNCFVVQGSDEKASPKVSMQDVRAGHRLAAISGRIENCNELAKMITSTCSQKQAMIVDVEYDKYADYTSVLIIA